MRSGDREKELVVRSTLGAAYCFDGDFKRARGVLSRIVETYHPVKDVNLQHEIGFDVYLQATGNLMRLEAITGHMTQAEHYQQQCLTHALQSDDLHLIIQAYTFVASALFIVNDKATLAATGQKALERIGNDSNNDSSYRYFLCCTIGSKTNTYNRHKRYAITKQPGNKEGYRGTSLPYVIPTSNTAWLMMPLS